MNHMLGCAAQWDEALVQAMVQDAAGAGGQPLPDGRPGELPPGLAGGRDRLGASRHRATSMRASAPAARGGCMNARGMFARSSRHRGAGVRGSAAGADNDFDYCLLCHGANANGNYGIRAPKLSGMEPWYLARQLENFAAGVRGAPAGGCRRVTRWARWRCALKQEGTLEAAVKFIGTLESKQPAADRERATSRTARRCTRPARAATAPRAKAMRRCRRRRWPRARTGTWSRSSRTTRQACAAPMSATLTARRCAPSPRPCRTTRPSPTSSPISTP